MENVLLVIHYFVCIFLVIVILLQAGKGADMGAAFGGSSQTVFGSRGAATFLSKLTTGVAVVFLVTSISLASIARNKSKSSILKTVTPTAPAATPVPGAVPASSPQPAATAQPAMSAPQASPAPK
jgi:preprotein translocase subunit SecG